MTDLRLPRLMDSQLQPLGTLEPINLSIQLNLTTLSTAVMTLLPDAAIQVGQFVELFTPQGSAGIFRVEQVEHSDTLRASLTHGLTTLADGLFQVAEESVTLPASQLLADLLARQTLWQMGTISLAEDVAITCQAGASTLLETLLAVMDALPGYRLSFDQRTTPWVLHVLPLAEDGLSECRLTRNLQSLTVEADRSELCTRLYLPGMAEPLEADTISQWGAVTRLLDADRSLTEAELLQRGKQYLEQHKEPLLTVSLDAVDLSHLTGCTLDAFRLGAPCRICFPQAHTAITHRVVGLSWSDVCAAPELVRVTLANRTKTAASLLAGLIVDSTLVKRQVTRQWNTLGDQKNLIIAAEDSIALLSKDIDIHAQDILTLRAGVEENEASITLANGRIDANANEIALHAKTMVTLQSGIDDNAASIVLANGRIDANANEIALHAKTMVSLQSGIDDNAASITLANGRIDANANEIALHAKTMVSLQSGIDDNAASITLANGRIDANANEIALHAKTMVTLQAGIDDNSSSITLMKDEIALKADKITLNGYVTMSKFEAEFASLMDGYAYEFSTTDLSASTITLGSSLTATNGYVSANTLIGSNLTLDGKSVVLKSRTVVTGFTPQITKYSKSVMKSDGSSETITYVGNIDFTKNTTTLYYYSYE